MEEIIKTEDGVQIVKTTTETYPISEIESTISNLTAQRDALQAKIDTWQQLKDAYYTE